MSEPKTKATENSVKEFLDSVEPVEKRADSFALLDLFTKITGEKAVMWGGSIVGFGTYHYKSERSRQEGDWMRVGFSPRKQNLTLYILNMGMKGHPFFKRLGKYKTSNSSFGGCLYINKLADVDIKTLEELIKTSDEYIRKAYPAS